MSDKILSGPGFFILPEPKSGKTVMQLEFTKAMREAVRMTLSSYLDKGAKNVK